MPGAAIDKDELFRRLAEGLAAGITVVAPNARLPRELMREFDAFQLARGLASWEAPDILPFDAFVARLWDDAIHAEGGEALPQLLGAAEELHLWEEAIGGSERGRGLIASTQAAAQCRDAWKLMHAWRIGAVRGTEDAEAFVEWSAAYARRAGNEADAARLPDLAVARIGARKPKALVAYAFDLLTPQQRDFFAACGAEGVEVRSCAPGRREAQPSRLSFPGAREELEAAARWGRARLEAGAQRIGLVVPGLRERRREVARILARTLGTSAPFNISIGVPLADHPLVADALSILALASGEVEFEDASALLRSPFLGGAQAELARRARLDARLRRRLPARLTLAKLVGAVEPCPLLRERLEALFAAAGAGAERTPHGCARHFTALLEAAGFPGERGLDSAEFQALARWNEMLAELAALERVAPRLAPAQALAKLRRACADTLFQPESPEAPVQVLGILESAGLEFDALWVSGLTDEAWPLDARPNPFIPVGLQRAAGVPEATAEGAYALDRRITEHWFAAAGEVIVSHALHEGDRALSPSPLVAQLPEGRLELPAYPRHRDRIFAARMIERVPDGAAPPLPGNRARGGTRVLADQAACPFRAFARHRLGAQALDEPVEGMDALARGTLLHDLMAQLWRELRASAALAGDVSGAIGRAAAAAVAEAGLEGRFAQLETARLAKLARDWLEVERAREPFTVAAIEEKRELSIGALALSGRIDRMDRLADGTHALIDYKSGSVTRGAWTGERPDDPQLPLYAVTAQEEVSAIAFARLKTGEMKFTGWGRDASLVDAAKFDWAGMLAGWRQELEGLAHGFAAGEARVDPKRGAQTCRLCDLQPLCRVHEKLALAEGEEEEAAP